ncbi:MAG: TetR/AcrR family transcriptional regulator [Deltaproteobacteria bacterium]|nr:TetR/AcrR family transcriptional regulator [Deltaproteobacteria bacterium]
MPRRRFERASPEKGGALLDAATEEFASRGYDGASVNRILAAAGFSKGSFYYYFDDKADLAAAVVEREAGKYLGSLSSLTLPNTPAEFWAETNRLVELGLEQTRKTPASTDALSRLGTAMARDPALLDRLPRSLLSEATEKLGSFWKRGQEVGAIRTDLPVGTLIALLQGFKLVAVSVLLPADRAPTAEEFETFLRIHLGMVRRISEVNPRITEEQR